MNIQTGGKVSGVYGIKVLRNAGTDKEYIEDFGESPNMLLDGFFERFASGNLSAVSWSMFVGSGTTPAEATQTQLVSQVGSYDQMSVTSNDNVKVGEDYIASSTGVAEWAIGVIVGNISEVGVRLGSRIGSTVDSRALIVDSQGSPATITVTAEDKLIVSYTLKYIIPIQQHVSVVDFAGTQTTCTLERLMVLDKGQNNLTGGFLFAESPYLYFGAARALADNPEGSTSGSISSALLNPTSSSISQGSRRITYFVPTDKGNVGGIGYAQTIGDSRVGLHFDPPIPKDNTKTLTLNFDFTLTRA